MQLAILLGSGVSSKVASYLYFVTACVKTVFVFVGININNCEKGHFVTLMHTYWGKKEHTYLEWFSPKVTAILQIPWQVSMSPFWTASLSCSWRASTWGTSLSKVFTYLQDMGTTIQIDEHQNTVKSPGDLQKLSSWQTQWSAEDRNITWTAWVSLACWIKKKFIAITVRLSLLLIIAPSQEKCLF